MSGWAAKGPGHLAKLRSVVKLLRVMRVENMICICRIIPLWVSFNGNSKGVFGVLTQVVWQLHVQFMTKTFCDLHATHIPWDWRKGVDAHKGPDQAGFRVTWPGLPPCWLAVFPKQDVPLCSHRAHRWLTTCFWQDGSSLVLEYAQPRATRKSVPREFL